MSLLNYWPTHEEINLCINHEAEGAHDAVLLAVHQPSPLSYRLISSGKSFEASEDELFKYLMTKTSHPDLMWYPSLVHLELVSLIWCVCWLLVYRT